MTDETSIEDKTAAVVAERRKRGPNKPKQEAERAPLNISPVIEPEAAPEPVAVAAAPEPAATAPAKHSTATKRRLFPVVVERNYHPINDFLINGEAPSPEQRVKVYAGQAIDMDLEEARDAISKGIVRRNDPIG